MNKDIFDDILEQYTNNFEDNWILEDYKWKVVQDFRLWNSNSQNFIKMFNNVTKSVDNLIYWYQLQHIQKLITIDSKSISEAFNILFDKNVDVVERCNSFRDKIITENLKHGFNKSDGCDVRTIATFLALRYPEDYSIFKKNTAQEFSDLIEYGLKFKNIDLNTIPNYNNMVEDVINYIPNEHLIWNKYHEKLLENITGYYQDSSNRMLAQDIIFFSTTKYYKQHKSSEKKSKELVKVFYITANSKNINKEVLLKASKNDYIKQQKVNTKVGRQGEQYVLKYETDKLNNYGISKKPEWVSKTKGDGIGYDILSYDRNGNEIYIEVKSTNGSLNSTFYITANELECSKQYPNKYKLYRIYHLNSFKPQIAIYEGSLEKLCIHPSQYIVSGKNIFIKDNTEYR